MKLSLQDLSTLFPGPLWLGCEPSLCYKDLTNPQRYSNETARHNASLNVVCLSAFITWANQNLTLEHSPTVWPNEAGLSEIWEVVNGTAILLNGSRLVLLPSDAMDTEAFTVPQEWVDIPSWRAEYYLPMQVNVEENWICLWGYVLHSQLKAHGDYDPIYRMYSVDRDWVIPDLDLFWQAQKIGIQEQDFVASVDGLLQSQIDRFIQFLSQPSPYSPRLDLDFAQWAMMLERADLRQKLYQQRLQNVTSPVQSRMINTGLWLKDKIDDFTQELSWVLLPKLTPELGLMRASTQHLTPIISQLKGSGVEIPDTARGAYQDFVLEHHLVRCYAIAWTVETAGNTPQWSLLLVVTPQPGTFLSTELRMVVEDETQVLVERSLDGASNHQLLFAGVSGAWEETFQVTIGLANGTSLTLPPFGFHPESS
jgi:Protein of unknown function (DUF1822)